MLSNEYPRVKPTLLAAIWKRNLYLVAGADDVINTTRATAGAGGGIDSGPGRPRSSTTRT